MKNKEKPFGASPSVLIVHDDEPKGFDTVIRRLAQLENGNIEMHNKKGTA